MRVQENKSETMQSVENKNLRLLGNDGKWH